MRPRHPPCEHALDALSVEGGKNFRLHLVELKSRCIGIHEALKFAPENLHKRKPSRGHEPGKNGLIGDGVVQIPVLEPAIQGAEVALHVRHGKVVARIEVEEQAETPAFPENANDAVFLSDGDKGKAHSGHIGDVVFEYRGARHDAALRHDLQRNCRGVDP